MTFWAHAFAMLGAILSVSATHIHSRASQHPVETTSGAPTYHFEPHCLSANDYGWPRFQSVVDLRASPWAFYFSKVYGELPAKYPVCIYDLWGIDKEAYEMANITGHAVVPPDKVKEGDLFEGGSMGYMIYHGQYKALPDNTWVEVTHTAVPSELSGFWVWIQRGSGIWYNTGRTKVFPTPADPSQIHKEAISFLIENCSIHPSWKWPQLESDIFGFCAREKGFDSIQFEPQAGQNPVGTFGLTGMMEMVIVNMEGRYSCGVENARQTPLRAGWMASRHCDCQNYQIAYSCGLMRRPPFPFSVIGSSPALCLLQEGPIWNRWKACDPLTCRATSCRPQSQSFMSDVMEELSDSKMVVV